MENNKNCELKKEKLANVRQQIKNIAEKHGGDWVEVNDIGVWHATKNGDAVCCLPDDVQGLVGSLAETELTLAEELALLEAKEK